jgi:hypothetical protein
VTAAAAAAIGFPVGRAMHALVFLLTAMDTYSIEPLSWSTTLSTTCSRKMDLVVKEEIYLKF